MALPTSPDQREYDKFVEDGSGNTAVRAVLAGGTINGPLTITVDDINALLVEKANGTDVFRVDSAGQFVLASAVFQGVSHFIIGSRMQFGFVNSFNNAAAASGPEGGAGRRLGLFGGLSNVTMFTNSAGLSADFVLGDQTHPTTYWTSNSVLNTELGSAYQDADNLNFQSTGGIKIKATRFKEAQGASVASANDMTLGTDGNYFPITGTTTINTIAGTGWVAGNKIQLSLVSGITLAHNTAGAGASLLLAGGANFVTAAASTIEFVYNGVTWDEISRTSY